MSDDKGGVFIGWDVLAPEDGSLVLSDTVRSAIQSPEKQKITLLLLCLLLIAPAAVTSCSNTPSPITYFPVQNEPHDSCPDGLIEGKLVLENGSLRLTNKYDASDNSSLLIWPYGFSFHTGGENLQVLDSNNKLVARAGDELMVGGGGGDNRDFINTLAHPPLPEDCPGPYWLVCGTIRNDTLELEKARERLNLPD